MKQGLSHALIRIFTYGFFKEHAGQLLFLFVTLISYCFLINTLGDVPLSVMIYSQYLMTITLVRDPFIMILFFLVCLIYNIKSWKYVALQLSLAEQQFIYYSSTAMPRQKQIRSWFFVQLLINMPAVVYAVFALVIGLIWHYYLLPVVILCFLFLLTFTGALLYWKLANRLQDTPVTALPQRLTRQWKKPLFSLFLYHILDKRKIAFVIAKGVTAAIICSGAFHIIGDKFYDQRLAGIAVMLFVFSHAVLLFQEQHFEQYQLSFMRNFPYGRIRIYLNSILTHILLLLPEYIWLLLAFRFTPGFTLILLGISITQLLRGICYQYAPNMRMYLPVLFILFFILFWSIMYGVAYWLITANFIASFLLFYKGYFKQENAL